MTSEPLEIYLLGDFRIRIGERIIPDAAWKLRKAAGIVKLLALEPGHRLHREQIMDALWPELDPDAAANNFRYALHTARRILDADGLPERAGEYLTLGDAVWVDVQAFEQALDAAWRHESLEAFQRAVKLYGGELLPADRYEEWLDARRSALRTSYLAALTQLARLHMQRDEPAAALGIWQQLIKIHPVQEEAHVQCMLLHARAGHRQQALAQYDLLVQILADELGIEPDPVTNELAGAIRSGQFTTATTSQPGRQTVARSNLPAPTTALIGRERELAEIQQAFATARVVTITGPGGAGKTRLASELARQAVENFRDGVFIVALAPVGETDMVAMALLQALDLNTSGSQTPAEALVGYLQERSILLVLDNFEHVVSAAPLVSTLLEACPLLNVLTTSRVPLRLRGEREYPLRALPDDAAAALFIERSTAVRPEFDPGADQMSVITHICRKLDGLPLAIELAAARSRVLNPSALLDRLSQPLTLLTGGSRDLPDRQQTLRATIDWSYKLLSPDLQTLFRALAVFPGTWTLEAASAVCPDGLDALDGVTLLVENSLVEQIDTGSETRFSMLETIREFGMEQLTANGEAEGARLNHADYFLSMAERLMTDLRGPTGATNQIKLAAEHDHLRAALTFMLQRDPECALRVIAGLEKYWFTRGSFIEWEYWIDEALSHGSTTRPEDRARALHQLAFVCFYDGRLERSRAAAEASLDIAVEFNLLESMGRSTSILGLIEGWSGNPDRSMQLAEEALGYYRASGNTIAVAGQIMNMAIHVLQMGDYERGREMMEEALSLHRATGDAFFIAMSLGNLGEVLREMGMVREAAQHLDEALELARSIGASQILTEVLVQRSLLAIGDGQQQTARELLTEGALNARAVRQGDCLPFALEACAAILTSERDFSRAARMFAEADVARKALNLHRRDRHQEWCDPFITRCRESMTPDAWERAWKADEVFSIDAAITRVLDNLAPQ